MLAVVQAPFAVEFAGAQKKKTEKTIILLFHHVIAPEQWDPYI